MEYLTSSIDGEAGWLQITEVLTEIRFGLMASAFYI